MHVVALVNQKGGSGKSTLTACLAVAARETGERVFLIDMDPQKSLTKWGYWRLDKDLPVEAVSAAKLETALATLAQGNVSLVIIDTPATNSPAADAAMRCADLCLIPARPTIFDIWSSEATRAADAAMRCADLCLIPARPTMFDIWSSEATRGKLKTLRKEYAFVLTQCPALQESQRVSDGAAALEAMGGLLRPLVGARVDYQEAARKGLGVTEVDSEGKAAEEMRQLWASLKRRLARSKSPDKARQAA